MLMNQGKKNIQTLTAGRLWYIYIFIYTITYIRWVIVLHVIFGFPKNGTPL